MQTLLTITDDADFEGDLREALQRSSRSLAAAPNSRVALRLLERETPALIVLCMDLAGGDALELLLSIRGLGVSVPVIAMASIRRPHYDKRLSAALHLGANIALAKPVPPDIIFEAIDRLIGPAS
jgi:DNA-binding response OmpR family regulator